MKRIFKLSACFAALAAAYAAALSRPDLQGRNRIVVALVRSGAERRKREGGKQVDYQWPPIQNLDRMVFSSTSCRRRLRPPSLSLSSGPALSPCVQLIPAPALPLSHTRLSDKKNESEKKKKKLPALALLCFGLYALLTLLLGIATFRDVPQASARLQKDIAEARRDLARRGVVDVVASD